MNWIQQNLIDRGKAFEEFLDGRRQIIFELQKIHTKLKQQPKFDEKIILEASERVLIDQLKRLESTTEERLKEIRERRQLN